MLYSGAEEPFNMTTEPTALSFVPIHLSAWASEDADTPPVRAVRLRRRAVALAVSSLPRGCDRVGVTWVVTACREGTVRQRDQGH